MIKPEVVVERLRPIRSRTLYQATDRGLRLSHHAVRRQPLHATLVNRELNFWAICTSDYRQIISGFDIVSDVTELLFINAVASSELKSLVQYGPHIRSCRTPWYLVFSPVPCRPRLLCVVTKG